MTLPGFTGDSSLYRSVNHYGGFAAVAAHNSDTIVASILPPKPFRCGGVGQPCCPVRLGSEGSGCQNGVDCLFGFCGIQSCGWPGEPCCGDNTCFPGSSCFGGRCM
jgi:hypothetical protein